MPRKLTAVVVDRTILDGFKRRALKHYPKEYAEQCWGKVRYGRAHIFAIAPIELNEQSRHHVEFDFDQPCGTKNAGLKLLGSIHTHPAPFDGTEPSDADIQEAAHDKEIVWGILAIRKTAKRCFFACRFWSENGELELMVSEVNKGVRK